MSASEAEGYVRVEADTPALRPRCVRLPPPSGISLVVCKCRLTCGKRPPLGARLSHPFVVTLMLIGWLLTVVAAYRTLPETLGWWSERTMFYLHGNETTIDRGMALAAR